VTPEDLKNLLLTLTPTLTKIPEKIDKYSVAGLMRNSPANRPKHTKTYNFPTGKTCPEQANHHSST
jgi:hypothetical protein